MRLPDACASRAALAALLLVVLVGVPAWAQPSEEVVPDAPVVAGEAGADALTRSPSLDIEGGAASEDPVTPIVPDPSLQVGDFREVVPFVFPTTGEADFAYGYDDPRDGGRRVHKGVDLFVPRHSPLFATVAGTICQVHPEDAGNAGRHLSVCGEDGRRYLYLHMDNDTEGTDDGAAPITRTFANGISEGAPVRAGQLLGWSGDSGNAEGTPPHLHFEIRDPHVIDYYGDARLDPYPSLVAALADGRVLEGPPSEPTGDAVVDPVIIGAPPRTAPGPPPPPSPSPAPSPADQRLTGARGPLPSASAAPLAGGAILVALVLPVGVLVRRRLGTGVRSEGARSAGT